MVSLMGFEGVICIHCRHIFIGASLSKPHTCWKTMCMSVTYAEIMNEKMQ